MDQKDIKLLNEGTIAEKYMKEIIRFVCLAASEANPDNVIEGLKSVQQDIEEYSNAYKNLGIKPVGYDDKLLTYCFNQKNYMPAYVYHWLHCCFHNSVLWEKAEDKSVDVSEIYNTLIQEYVKRYRMFKAEDKECEQYAKEARRKTCKLFASGKYKAMFELLNKPFSGYMDDKELVVANHITQDLFCRQFMDIAEEKPDFDRTAAAFLLGCIQGEHTAAERYAKEQEARRSEKR